MREASLRPRVFGVTKYGEKASAYVLRGKGGLVMEVTDYGGRVSRLLVPDEKGELVDVTIGFDSANGWDETDPFFGAIIGRYGNRIWQGRFTLDGKTYQLDCNDVTRDCHLHGGTRGWYSYVWKAAPFVRGDDVGIVFTKRFPDGEQGFPGNVEAKVTYTVTPDNTWRIEYEATTDKPTPMNLTQHVYFNMNGIGDVHGQELQIDADAYVSVDGKLNPLPGPPKPVAGTPFDFRAFRKIGEQINAPDRDLQIDPGYDHSFCLNGKGFRKVAEMRGDRRRMEIWTDQPGVQFYSGNLIDRRWTMKDGIRMMPRSHIAMETQHHPNTPNRPDYPQTTLRPGETYRTVTEYRFRARADGAEGPKSPHGDFATWSPTPPMGWNSWDCYGSIVNEAQFRANVGFLAERLRGVGYEYAVVDIRWTVQNEHLQTYNQANPLYTLDKWGRYLPAPNRFPSAAGGRGFKPLADWVHSKGLKFGCHIMRGVPKEAVARKLPVKGAEGISCDMITDGKVECKWLRDNCTVIRAKKGAQEYYDSLFELYAEWGVDFVKVDDLTRPYHADEIEMIRRAIDRCGRKIVFSCSPGETPLAQARHVETQANMWRLVDDVWDTWWHVKHLLPIACRWLNAAPREGTWPDCDMIPLGKLGVTGHNWSISGVSGRMCRMSRDEQRTLMNLFAIARSPLMLGADLTQLKDDPETLSLITDPMVLAANRDGRRPKPLFWNRDECAIVSENVRGGRFLALFNLRGHAADVTAEGVTRRLPAHGSALVVLKK